VVTRVRTRRPTAPIALLQGTTFVSTLDRFAMPPMLVAIAHDLDAPLAGVVHAAGAYFLVYGLCQPLWGAVSDRLGRVRTMRLTLLAGGICTLLSAASGSVVVLAVARGLAGGFFGAAYPSTLVYVGDTVAPEVRQRDVARLMVGVAVGTALASVAAGALAELVSWRLAFIATGVASLILVALLRGLPEPDPSERPESAVAAFAEVARSGTTLLVVGFALVEGIVLLGALTLLPAAVEHGGASATIAGAVTGVYGLAVFVGAWLVSRLSSRRHPATLIALGAAIAVGACLALAWSRAPIVAGVVAALLGLSWTSMHSTLQTWATEVLPSARATVVSLFASSLFIGSALGAVLVAGLADAGRYPLIYLLYAAVMVPLGTTASWARRRWHHSSPADS
jgi:predicted MFS family arabinose efflux permease